MWLTMKSRLLVALSAVALTAATACDARSGGALDGNGSGGATVRPGDSGSGGSTLPGTGGAGTGPAGATGSGGDQASGTGGRATGGSAGAMPDAGAATACTSWARALCAKGEDCAPFATTLVFGSRAICEERLQLDCLARFAPGSSATPADTTTCAESLSSQSCTTFARGDLGAACAPRPGSSPNGASCLDDHQCASTFCARAPDAACGVCAAVTTAGSACVRGSCSAGTVCPKGAATAATATCLVPEPGPIGAVCTVSEQCDVGHGVACNPLTGRCIKLALASSGACGLDLAAATYTACGASGSCSPTLAGKCVAAAPDGATCSTADTGPPCLPPARCVGGRCSLPDPSLCAL